MATVPIPNEEERLQDVKTFTEAHNPDSTLARWATSVIRELQRACVVPGLATRSRLADV